MVKRETLKNGEVLKALIFRYLENQTEQNAYAVIRCLRDSEVVVPCLIEMSDRDKAKFESCTAGDEISAEDDIKFIPDTLNNGEHNFLPVFSNTEEMGEYGKDFNSITYHFFAAIDSARQNDKLQGIVVNAFTTPFIVDKNLFDFIVKMPTNVED